jgi:SAM-dependent methyltransferase
MDSKAHWENVYRTRLPTEVSWFQPNAARSLALIRQVNPPPGDSIIDIGGGASTLVDDLLDAGYCDITVLDLSGTALGITRSRLGDRERAVRWIEADLLEVSLPEAAYAVWHDRAVFHFLTTPDSRARYLAQVRKAVRPGGHVLIATFAEDGPTRCSGLEVARFSTDGLHALLGGGFEPLTNEREEHVTPAGITQAFNYCLYRVDRSAGG